jgi:SAM-dependent methyltransferase
VLDEDRLEGAHVVTSPRSTRVPVDRLSETREAFDGVAPTYHASNAANTTLSDIRRRTLDALVGAVHPGASLLDLGCGPGTDAEALARRGFAVTAIDWSPAMIREAARRLDDAGLLGRVDLRRLGIHELAALGDATFDAAYSTLGPLNCVPDLAEAARLIAARIRPGGVVVASVIGRVCPWEIALYGARRDWARIAIRFAREFTAVPLSGRTVWTRYYTPAEFERAFAPAGFERVALRALGVFVPPPYMDAFCHRHPALVARLRRIEDRVGAWPPFRAWGDHFLMVLRRVDR